MIRVGVAGWDYPDWAGIVYPAPAPKRFDRLVYLARFFDVVEINVSFYRQIDARTARSWTDRLAAADTLALTAKLYQAFTHTGVPVRGSDVDVDLRTEAKVFRSGIDPLLQSGRLVAVLMQFPHSFHDRPASRSHLTRLAELLSGLPLVAEFRHRSWDDAGALAFLRERGVGFCNIDQPALGSTLPPTEHVTSRIAYVRLHGRNERNWFSREETARSVIDGRTSGSARYDYYYSMEELTPWVERARRLGSRAEEVVVIANNHYRGKGPANALMLKGAITKRRVPAPADLVATYPDLKTMTESVERSTGTRPRQGKLF